MSKSRASKTKAAGLMIGLTKYSKQYGAVGKTVTQMPQNRAMRRAEKHGEKRNAGVSEAGAV